MTSYSRNLYSNDSGAAIKVSVPSKTSLETHGYYTQSATLIDKKVVPKNACVVARKGVMK